MRDRLLVITLALALLASAPGVLAHHSYAGFDAQPSTVTGTLESLTIANPHTLIVIRTTVNERFTIVWQAINGLRRLGLLEGPASLTERMHVGDQMTVTGRVKRDEQGNLMVPDSIEHQVNGRIWARYVPDAERPQPGSNR